MLVGTPKQKQLGDDDGCFAAAVRSVEQFGGVIEHPEGSHAFEQFGLGRPKWRAGWDAQNGEGSVCCVAQGNYGHRARKLTWLYYVGSSAPPALDWSVPTGMARLDNGNGPGRPRALHRDRIEKLERLESPAPFANLLLELAAHARR